MIKNIKRHIEFITALLYEKRGINQEAFKLARAIFSELSKNKELDKIYIFQPLVNLKITVHILTGNFKVAETWLEDNIVKMKIPYDFRDEHIVAHELNHAIETFKSSGESKSGINATDISDFYEFAKRSQFISDVAKEVIYLIYKSDPLEINATVQETYQIMFNKHIFDVQQTVAWDEANKMLLDIDNQTIEDIRWIFNRFNSINFKSNFTVDSLLKRMKENATVLKKKLGKLHDLIIEENEHALSHRGRLGFLINESKIIDLKHELHITHIEYF